MKKTLLVVTLVILALGALGVGVVFAQGGQPPASGFGPGMMWDGEEGPLHDYMLAAMADALNMDVATFETRHDAGETFYQIALAQDFSAAEIPALMQDARAKALDAAAADGVVSQDQADWMGSRGFSRGGMMGGYGDDGTCPMFDSDEGATGRFGQGYGPGMMGGGGSGRWQ